MTAVHHETGRRDTAAPALASWLSLAAAPSFAAMAFFTWASGADADMVCSMHAMSPLSGMAPMYLLMSAFHLSPWLKQAARRPVSSFKQIASSGAGD